MKYGALLQLEDKLKEDDEKKYRIWYYCDVCGGEITMYPDGNDHKALIKYMKENKWGHKKCYENPNALRTKSQFRHVPTLSQDGDVLKFRIWYYCNVCGDEITLYPNSDSHKALIKYSQSSPICPKLLVYIRTIYCDYVINRQKEK